MKQTTGAHWDVQPGPMTMFH